MENEFGQIASLIGNPVRAKILWALLDGRAYTATELALYTNTTAQNISMHLNKLVKADILKVESQGRHRYYNYTRPDIAFVIEALANLIPKTTAKKPPLRGDKPVEYCRTCYDHLAGKVGVLLTEGLLHRQIINKGQKDFEIGPAGATWFANMGIDTATLKQQKRSFAKCCLDWSERRHHLAGSLGAALLNTMLSNGWLRKTSNSRAVSVTTEGRKVFYEKLGIEL